MFETAAPITYHALETKFWLPARSESSLKRLIAALADGEAKLFTVAFPSTFGFVPALDTVFALAGSPEGSPRARLTIAFTWSHQRGFSLPSMTGALVARRFGPFASISVRALYGHDTSAPGRIFQEAMGERLARKTFDALVAAIQLLLAPGQTMETSSCVRS